MGITSLLWIWDSPNTTVQQGCYKDFNCSVPEGLDPCKYTKEPTHQNLHTTHATIQSGKVVIGLKTYTVHKDSVGVPAGGYVVIQFVANNPGYWFLHCHMEGHSMVGMAVIINEASDRHNPPPSVGPLEISAKS